MAIACYSALLIGCNAIFNPWIRLHQRVPVESAVASIVLVNCNGNHPRPVAESFTSSVPKDSSPTP